MGPVLGSGMLHAPPAGLKDWLVPAAMGPPVTLVSTARHGVCSAVYCNGVVPLSGLGGHEGRACSNAESKKSD